MADKIYCYPNSNVLINKLDIRELDKLHNFERKLTMLRLSELFDKPIVGKFNFDHLKQIHRYIFQDIYEWAGQIRTVDIAKENTFVKRLAYYFSEINALHPFREGNGRSQREFIRSLALHNGYILNFAKINAEDMIMASRKSFLCDYGEMERVFAICIQKRK